MNLDSLLAQIGRAAAQQIPPVEKWNPELSGTMPMIIKADGSWWHEGEPIKRQELINIFASILKKEGKDYFLVTPVEKWRIEVEDCPLLVSMVQQVVGNIEMLTTTADSLVLSAEYPLKMSSFNGILLPQVKIRHNLWARLSRNAWYELLQYASENQSGQVVVRSSGQDFVLS